MSAWEKFNLPLISDSLLSKIFCFMLILHRKKDLKFFFDASNDNKPNFVDRCFYLNARFSWSNLHENKNSENHTIKCELSFTSEAFKNSTLKCNKQHCPSLKRKSKDGWRSQASFSSQDRCIIFSVFTVFLNFIRFLNFLIMMSLSLWIYRSFEGHFRIPKIL